jgi:uncharacterized protein (TIGR02646 family)
MRRLNKAAEPPIIGIESHEWTMRFVTEQGAGLTSFTPWREVSVVSALNLETCGKCAYCEAIIADVAAPNVEHILPKSRRPELVVDWQNLTLACPACNSAKGTYYSETAPLINPYTDDPEEHLDFVGPVITGALGNDLGIRTAEKLKLMRTPLIFERIKRIQTLWGLIDRWARTSDPDEKLIFEEVVNDALADSAEFVGTLRAYAASLGFPLANYAPQPQAAT